MQDIYLTVHSFKAKIYRTGINWCVDVPVKITKQLVAVKGFIKIRGIINGYKFNKSLVTVKNSPYRLYVNGAMMKGGKTALGKVAYFKIQQDKNKKINEYPIPGILKTYLSKYKLTSRFNNLTFARKNTILKYLSSIKTKETLLKNIEKLGCQLRNEETNIRIP